MIVSNINENNLLQHEHVEIIDSAGNSAPEDILLIKEITLNIFLESGCKQELISSVACLPDMPDELVVGILFDRKLINSYSDITSITYNTGEDISANVLLSNHADNCIKVWSPGCVLPKAYENARIFELANIFASDTILHTKTNSTHSCILADNDNVYICVEDIGRHNTIDKAIGYALMNNITLSDCMIFTSARISSEMVGKIANAGIPILISKSVPTSMAVNLARKNHITLIGRAGSENFCKFT